VIVYSDLASYLQNTRSVQKLTQRVTIMTVTAKSLIGSVNDIKVPAVPPGGEGSATGEEVEITVVFTTPVILPGGHYFLRSDVLLANGDFLYLSAPRPIVPPGNPFIGDLQAWIRNSNLAPDWLTHWYGHCWRRHTADIQYYAFPGR
jgi:hypothetical protein